MGKIVKMWFEGQNLQGMGNGTEDLSFWKGKQFMDILLAHQVFCGIRMHLFGHIFLWVYWVYDFWVKQGYIAVM